MVKALPYNPAGSGFDSRWCHCNFPSGRTMAQESTQPLTEMNTSCISWGKGGRCVRLTTYHHPVPLTWNLGILTSWNFLGHSRPVNGTALPSLCLRKEGVAVFGGWSNVDIRKVWFIFICTAYQCYYNDRYTANPKRYRIRCLLQIIYDTHTKCVLHLMYFHI